MQNNLYKAVVDENVAELNDFSKDDILSYSHETYGNIFLVAAREGKLNAAKAIIAKLESYIAIEFNSNEPITIRLKSTSTNSILDFITANDKFNGRNAWTLAAIADNTEFLEYLYTLKERYSNNLRDWDIFHTDHSTDNGISYAINRGSKNAINYLLEKGIFIEASLKSANLLGIAGNIYSLYNTYLTNMSLSAQARIFLIQDQEGRTALTAAFQQQNSLIGSYIYSPMLKTWFESLISNPNEIDSIPRQLLQQMYHHYLNYHLDRLDVSSCSARVSQANNLSLQAQNVQQEGKKPRLRQKEIKRPYRSFKHERERQLLRQIATQIYHGFELSNYNSKGLVEVQVMHLENEGRHNLFIAANQGTITKDLYEFLTAGSLQATLTTAYSPPQLEGQTRSKRYATKLTKRVYEDTIGLPEATDQTDLEQANIVKRILQKANIKQLPISLQQETHKKSIKELTVRPESKHTIQYALNQIDTIFVVIVAECPHQERHAEEFLVDIRDSIVREQSLYACIGGKKRPCIGCSGRMEDKISKYGQNPGRFWVNTIKFQAPPIARKTLKLLFTKSSHISCREDKHILNVENKMPAVDYDSGSDSDIEIISNRR